LFEGEDKTATRFWEAFGGYPSSINAASDGEEPEKLVINLYK
jgi:hypothetical protein